MLDHVSLSVVDLERAAACFDAALAPLGYGRVFSFPTAVGYGPPGSGDKLCLKLRPEPNGLASGFHLAFTARDADAVDAFHAAALGAGARDEGAPGWRPQYGPGYYAAFVVDPDGHRLEAVWHAPPEAEPGHAVDPATAAP